MKKMNTEERQLFWLLGGLDFLSLAISMAAALIITRRLHMLPPYTLRSLIFFCAAGAVSFCAAFYCFYKPSEPYPRLRLKQVLHILFCNAALVTGMAVLLRLTRSALLELHGLLFFIYILNSLLNCLMAFAARRQAFYRLKQSRLAVRTAVLCSAETADGIVQELEGSVWQNVCGVFLLQTKMSKTAQTKKHSAQKLPDKPGPFACKKQFCGSEKELVQWVRSRAVDAVYIVLPQGSLPQHSADALVQELVSMGVQVYISTHLANPRKMQPHSEQVRFGQRLSAFAAAVHKPAHLRLKRAFDIVFGLLGCLAAAPVIALVAVPLKLESKGPLFFAQTRVGKNGRTFKIYKLRTMYADAEARKAQLLAQNEMQGLMFKMENDPRVTKVGRFLRRTSIDELPQFLNILKGDMSLVGTRPPTLDEFKQYESRHKRRLSMPTGLTGMWQTSGRSDITDFEEVVQLDLQYIDNWSVALDLQLIFKTILVLFKRQGAR